MYLLWKFLEENGEDAYLREHKKGGKGGETEGREDEGKRQLKKGET